MGKEKFIKYLLSVKHAGIPQSDWTEIIEISEHSTMSVEDIGKGIVDEFNHTLKEGEKRREFVSIKLKSKRKR